MKHCVIIPTYNSGPVLEPTVRSVLEKGFSVFLVVDGSTDGSDRGAQRLLSEFSTLIFLRLETNQGKGSAVLHGFKAARLRGFTHAVVFDSDGQHEAGDILKMIGVSATKPEAMILGVPIFGAEAPWLRVQGRRLGNWWTNLETLWGGIEDSLFGFRIYPIERSMEMLESIRGGRRFDFETQLAVRLYWSGVPAVSFPSKVTYFEKTKGGVTHFNYLRDNALLIRTHLSLSLNALCILPRLIRLRRHNRAYQS